jgi:hypothetical protein
VSAPAPLLRRASIQRVKGTPAFDIVLSGQREAGGLLIGPGQWAIPERVPVAVYRDGAMHHVGAGRVWLDRKGHPRLRGLWSRTPLGEYVKLLAAQHALEFVDLELEASVDNDGARVYVVLGVVITLPSDPPPGVPSAADAEGRLLADTSAELLGLAARIYAAGDQAEVAALADRVIACAVALGGVHQHCDPERQLISQER